MSFRFRRHSLSALRAHDTSTLARARYCAIEALELRTLLTVSVSPVGNLSHVDPTRETWVIIHGRQDNPSGMGQISDAVRDLREANGNFVQVLTVDWSELAQPTGAVDFTGEGHIPEVAQDVADSLKVFGFGSGLSATNLNLIGHSWGAHVANEVAKRLSGGVNRLIALDPAQDGGPFGSPLFDSDASDFRTDSSYSLAFLTSRWGSEQAAGRADDSFFVGFDNVGWGAVDNADAEAHSLVKSLFATIVRNNWFGATGSISPLFARDQLRISRAVPWQRDHFSISDDAASFDPFPAGVNIGTSSGAYEGEIISLRQGSDVWWPLSLKFFDSTGMLHGLGDTIPASQSLSIGTITPSSFIGSNQRTSLVISGAGFRPSSTLIFNDGVRDYPSTSDYLRVVSPTRIEYDIAVGTSAADWTVRVLNGGASSNELGFKVTAALDTTPPTASLALPANGGTVAQSTINANKYIDVTFSDTGGSGLNLSTITDPGAEFAISGITVNGAPALVSGTTYRYTFTGALPLGQMSVIFPFGAWADNAGNPNQAVTQTFTVVAKPVITNVSPNSLLPLALPQTQRIVITGTGFGASPSLHFIDTANLPYDRPATVLADGSLEYYIKVGTVLGQWSVQVGINGVLSDPATFIVSNAVAAPVISPAGGSFTAATQVTLSTATAGATIRYTTDGYDPTATSPIYSAPFTLSTTALVKARAFKSGMPDSAMTLATFTVNIAPAAPVISSVTPTTLQPVFGLQDIVISGSGFVPGSVLYFYDPSNTLRQNNFTLYFNPGHLEYELNVLATPGTWKVKVVNNPGGQESNLASFTVQQFPMGNAPTPTSPVSGTTGFTQHPTLMWSAVPNANYYRVLVAKSVAALPSDPNGNLIGSDGVWVSTTSSTQMSIAPPVISGQTYYWEVQANINTVPNGWSPIWSYTMAGELNVPPVVGGITATPSTVVQGQSINFIASGVYDVNVGNTVKWVEFTRESNGIPGLQTDGAASDTQMGIDYDGSDGWGVSASTFGLAAGTYTVYALATDTLYAKATSAPTTTFTVQSANLPAPNILDVTYVPGSTPATIRVRFNVDVSPTLPKNSFYLNNPLFTFPSTFSYDLDSNVATLSWASPFPEGDNYLDLLNLAAIHNAAGDPLTGPTFFPFFVLTGDVNRDRAVDFLDLASLAQHYNQSGGKEWFDGDFNGDGNVDFLDLAKLAQNYNTALPGAAVPSATSNFASDLAAAFAIAAPKLPVTIKPKPVTPKPPGLKAKPAPVVRPPVAKAPAPVRPAPVRVAPAIFGNKPIKPRRDVQTLFV